MPMLFPDQRQRRVVVSAACGRAGHRQASPPSSRIDLTLGALSIPTDSDFAAPIVFYGPRRTIRTISARVPCSRERRIPKAIENRIVVLGDHGDRRRRISSRRRSSRSCPASKSFQRRSRSSSGRRRATRPVGADRGWTDDRHAADASRRHAGLASQHRGHRGGSGRGDRLDGARPGWRFHREFWLNTALPIAAHGAASPPFRRHCSSGPADGRRSILR